MKLLSKLFIVFFGGMLLYHILQTVVVFGGGWLDSFVFAGIKDILRVLLVMTAVLLGWKGFIRSLQRDWIVYCMLFLLCVLSIILSWKMGVGFSSGMVGFKYDVWPLVILITAFAGGAALGKFPHLSAKTLLKILLCILVGGILWQGAKMLLPYAFEQLGYGPIGDYILGGSPPLWYRTGPGGTMRLQGIFAGPNNYGYFLVAFFSGSLLLLDHFWKQGKKKLSGILFVFLMVSIVMTLSRGAIVGALMQIGIAGWYFFPKWRKILIGCIIACCGGVVAISFSGMKQGSTTARFAAWGEGIETVFEKPGGYGLGSSGPSIHYEGVYLPENQYLQIAIDLGILGLVLWLSVFGFFGAVCYEVLKAKNISQQEKMILLCYCAGLLGLLIEGLFLHTFEDSMINYVFLGSFGLFAGSLRLNS